MWTDGRTDLWTGYSSADTGCTGSESRTATYSPRNHYYLVRCISCGDDGFTRIPHTKKNSGPDRTGIGIP